MTENYQESAGPIVFQKLTLLMRAALAKLTSA